MGTRAEVAVIPDCDVCKRAGQKVPAYADAKLRRGPWAYLCRRHFHAYRCELGTGRGQELVLAVSEQPC